MLNHAKSLFIMQCVNYNSTVFSGVQYAPVYSTQVPIFVPKNTDSTHRWIVRTRVVSIYTVCLGRVCGMSLLLKAFRMWFNSAGDIRI